MMGIRFFPQKLARPKGTETDENDENILVVKKQEYLLRDDDHCTSQFGYLAVVLKILIVYLRSCFELALIY